VQNYKIIGNKNGNFNAISISKIKTQIPIASSFLTPKVYNDS
jgi:hypothetical protein